MLVAAISTLAAMGTARSELLLAKMAEGKIPQAAATAKALKPLQTRSTAAQPQG